MCARVAQLTSIYQELIDALVGVGYEVQRDLFGAPYDWRLAADGLEQVPGTCARWAAGCAKTAGGETHAVHVKVEHKGARSQCALHGL